MPGVTRRGRSIRRRAAAGVMTALSLVAAALACGVAAARADLTSATSSETSSASTAEARGHTTGYDRTYKTDLVERLSKTPELVFLGGSRAQRFEPSVIEKLTGLSAFNYALQNCRPEDAYAVTSRLYARSPGARIRCVYAVQCTTFSDIDLHPGLLYDERLAAMLPATLVKQQKAAQGHVEIHSLLSCNHFTSRGCLLSNTYDERESEGRTLDESLTTYLASLLPRAASTSTTPRTRSEQYFRKFLALQNAHGVTPLIVIMPYQPTALRAFREVGWQAKLDRLKTYLRTLQKEYRFRVLNCTEIATFHGDAQAFYDGAHVKKGNARRILRYAVRMAPECFR